ncbi:MAG: Site-specific tyrosine recombinase [Ktedonobacterales bacterium]|jgi:integrase/recombinase XerD|nr:MAG: Site-specific tyrosine recombinase [Ktedonobacterales bacterium]
MSDVRPFQSEPVEQPSLFFPQPEEAQAAAQRPSLVTLPPLTAGSALSACALPYSEYLRRTNHSGYTITCFLSDLRMFTEFTGREMELRRIARGHITRWLSHLKFDRAAPPAPKTMARRVTFLKNFFAWLAETRVLPHDLAENIALTRPAPPLPELLFEDEVARLEEAASSDVRAQVLVTLLLATGLKKEEVKGLRLAHVDVADPEHPAIEVHFPGQAKRRRERRMELPQQWTAMYERYLERFQPREHVFECTDRNLNYILGAAVKRAKIEKRVTLQLLRDIYAVRQLRAGIAPEALRERLGLSEEAWYETAEKYRKLAFPA